MAINLINDEDNESNEDEEEQKPCKYFSHYSLFIYLSSSSYVYVSDPWL